MTGRVGFRIYLITDGDDDQQRRVGQALAALSRGIAAVQLRARAVTGRELWARAERLRELTRAHRAPLLINDRLDIALAVAADGVHLPARGLPVKAARRAIASARGGGDLLVAASTHSLAEARMAVAGGADLVTFGAVWATRSHPGVAPVGEAALAEAVQALSVPVFALGGLDPARARAAFSVGARVASLGHVLGADDPAAAARAFETATASPAPGER